MNKIKPLVSIVIPTYNEEQNIGSCLESIEQQSSRDFEVVIVNSKNTTDRTSAIAKKYEVNFFDYGKERSEQRNFGVDKSKGEYLLFIDSDMKLEKDVVKQCVRAVTSNPDIKALIIPEKSFGESYWAKCKALERNCYIGDESIEAPRFFYKKSFLKSGGYRADMISGEDWDLGNRIREQGYKVARVDAFILHNEGKLSLIKDLRKKLYYSRKSQQYIKSNVKGLKDVLLFLFRPAYFRNWKLLVSDPIHLPGFIFMKTMEFTVGGFGSIVYNLSFWKRLLGRS